MACEDEGEIGARKPQPKEHKASMATITSEKRQGSVPPHGLPKEHECANTLTAGFKPPELRESISLA